MEERGEVPKQLSTREKAGFQGGDSESLKNVDPGSSWSVGFVAGFLAKTIMHVYASLIPTTILGLVGSILGGLSVGIFSNPAVGARFHTASIVLSTIGAILVLTPDGRTGWIQ
jgi:uncharacterized membrane protein YeaQ/YmgE (transglycosylase-associated protein family)